MTMADGTSASVSTRTEAREWKRGWPTVVSGAIGYGAGPVLFLTTASVFVKPTMEATGWSSTEVLISPLVSFIFAVCGPIAGRIADRTSPRKTVAVGLAVYTLLVALFVVMPLNRLTFYGVGAAVGIAGSFAFMVPVNKAVAGWFDKSAGKAFGFVGAGGAAMPLIATPLVAYVVYTFGWRQGYLVLAGFALLVALPAIAIGLRSAPASQEQSNVKAGEHHGSTGSPSSTASAVLRTWRFWILFGSIVLGISAANAFTANMQPILLDGGLSLIEATSITSLFTIGSIIGRLGAGALLDAMNPYVVGATMLTLSGLAALTLTQIAGLGYAVVLIMAMMISVSSGGEGDVFSVLTLRNYGPEAFGVLFGWCYVAVGIGHLVGPYTFSFVRDATGGYTDAALVGCGLFFSAALLTAVYGVTHRRSKPTAHGPARDEDYLPSTAKV